MRAKIFNSSSRISPVGGDNHSFRLRRSKLAAPLEAARDTRGRLPGNLSHLGDAVKVVARSEPAQRHQDLHLDKDGSRVVYRQRTRKNRLPRGVDPTPRILDEALEAIIRYSKSLAELLANAMSRVPHAFRMDQVPPLLYLKNLK